jgi:hypothetical protein
VKSSVPEALDTLAQMKDRNKLKRKIPRKRQLEVPSSRAHVASSKILQSMKRASQSRDRKLVAKDGAVDEMFLIGPDLAKNAKVAWPDVDLIDEQQDLDATVGGRNVPTRAD